MQKILAFFDMRLNKNMVKDLVDGKDVIDGKVGVDGNDG